MQKNTISAQHIEFPMQKVKSKRICLWQGRRLVKADCLCESKDTFACECRELKDKQCVPYKEYNTCPNFIEELI